MTETYFTDNGPYPSYRIEIDPQPGQVRIYKPGSHGDYYHPQPTLTYQPQAVYIGKSPFNPYTEFFGKYGPKYDGNSILLRVEEKKYIFIGGTIFSFHSLHPIVTFVSPIGDATYPYAVDTENNYYLLLEEVIIKNMPPGTYDPYDYYYRNRLITADEQYIEPRYPILKEFQGIAQFNIGDYKHPLRYWPRAVARYNWCHKTFEGELSVIKTDGKQHILDRRQFAKLMRDFGEAIGFKPLPRIRVIRKFLW